MNVFPIVELGFKMTWPYYRTTNRSGKHWVGRLRKFFSDHIAKWRGNRSSEALLNKTIGLLKFAWTQTDKSVWTAPTELTSCDYPLSIQLRDHGGFVMCTAIADIVLDRVWIQRELALRLLEANTKFPYGAFRLHDRGDGIREVVYSHLIDARRYDANATALIALKIVGQLNIMLMELYACELIEANPRKANTDLKNKNIQTKSPS